jgi:two-component system response regulator NreC
MSIKIILADDHKIILEGLRSLIDNEKDMEVVAEAVNGRQAVNLAKEHTPDVVIMDINMPDLNGIEATQQINSKKTDIKVIALSMHSDKRYVAKMLQAGVKGYLLKDCAFDELIYGIRKVMSNHLYLSPQIDDIVIADYIKHLSKEYNNGLRSREREVLQLLAEGNTTKQISEKLNVSIKTVESHRGTIMKTLGFKTLSDLIVYAIKEGIISLED